MKMPRVLRPTFEFEVHSLREYALALYLIFRVGIKRGKFEVVAGPIKMEEISAWIIPRYSFVWRRKP